MGWASYQEDNIDARGKSKSFTRIPKSSRSIPKSSQPVKSQFKGSPDDPFKSTPVPTTPDIIQQPKLSPKPRQRIRRREPLKKQDVPVAKTRYVAPDEIQRRIQLEIIRQDKESKAIYPH